MGGIFDFFLVLFWKQTRRSDSKSHEGGGLRQAVLVVNETSQGREPFGIITARGQMAYQNLCVPTLLR